jgi:translation initiation factor 1
MNSIVDFNNTFNQTNFGELAIQKGKIHIRFQKTGPRSITIIEGLDDDLDLKRISKAMKKSFNCAATVLKDTDDNEVIQLQGDQREFVRAWLVDQEVITENEAKERIVTHGF